MKKTILSLTLILTLASFKMNDSYPCHPLGDLGACTHQLHPRGDLGPCTHSCVDVYGNFVVCHPAGDLYPCTHPLHAQGDLYPCTHICY